MPWFKDGAHDRVFNSILNGTVSVTDTSKYLCGELKEGQGVCYYDLAHMEKLPELVRDLLADDARREEIVRAGIPVVEEKHTWIRRAPVSYTHLVCDGKYPKVYYRGGRVGRGKPLAYLPAC